MQGYGRIVSLPVYPRNRALMNPVAQPSAGKRLALRVYALGADCNVFDILSTIACRNSATSETVKARQGIRKAPALFRLIPYFFKIAAESCFSTGFAVVARLAERL